MKTPSRRRTSTSSNRPIAIVDDVDGMGGAVTRIIIASIPSLYLRRVAFLSECGFSPGEIARILKRSPSAISHARRRLGRLLT